MSQAVERMLKRGPLQRKLMRNLKVYKGASHGLCTTEKDRVNSDLLEFIKA